MPGIVTGEGDDRRVVEGTRSSTLLKEAKPAPLPCVEWLSTGHQLLRIRESKMECKKGEERS